MITSIFFDLYGTLAGFKPTRFQIQSEACEAFGVALTEEGTARGYGKADAYMTEQNSVRPLRERSKRDVEEFFREYESRVLAGSGVEVDLETAGQIWVAVRAIPYDMVIFEDVNPALNILKDRGMKLGVLSNMNQPGSELLKKFDLAGLIDFAVTSYEIGSEKPHPPIFLEALKRAKSNVNESVHVGDQIGSDIEGAEKIGISPILLDRDCNHLGFNRCPRISSMKELDMAIDQIESLSVI